MGQHQGLRSDPNKNKSSSKSINNIIDIKGPNYTHKKNPVVDIGLSAIKFDSSLRNKVEQKDEQCSAIKFDTPGKVFRDQACSAIKLD